MFCFVAISHHPASRSMDDAQSGNDCPSPVVGYQGSRDVVVHVQPPPRPVRFGAPSRPVPPLVILGAPRKTWTAQHALKRYAPPSYNWTLAFVANPSGSTNGRRRNQIGLCHNGSTTRPAIATKQRRHSAKSHCRNRGAREAFIQDAHKGRCAYRATSINVFPQAVSGFSERQSATGTRPYASNVFWYIAYRTLAGCPASGRHSLCRIARSPHIVASSVK